MRCKAGMMSRRYLPPGDVVGLAAVRGDNQYTLSWSAPANDGGLPVTDYQVTVVGVSDNQQYSQSTTGGARTATLTGLSSCSLIKTK